MKTTKGHKPIYIIGHGSCLPEPDPKLVNISASNDKNIQYPAYIIDSAIAHGTIPPAKLRRLGKIQKMTISSTYQAIQDCSIDLTQSDVSVVVGTGLGSMNETVSFLENMFVNKEELPKPACFTNSVHNAVASQIAIIFQCKGENHTFTQNAMSFEIALKYSLTLLRDDRAKYSIVCGCDELCGWLFDYGKHMRWWKSLPNTLTPMNETATPGTVPGEGSASFILCNQADKPAGCSAVKIAAIEMCYIEPKATPKTLVDFITTSLSANELHLNEIDRIIFGANASSSDKIYHDLKNELDILSGKNIPYETYKQYCGEFCTASAVGLAKAVYILKNQNPHTQKTQTFMIYNYNPDGYCSLYVLQSC